METGEPDDYSIGGRLGAMENEMSYYQGIGDLSTVTSAAQIALRVSQDPALSEVVSLIDKIKTLSPSRPGAPPSVEPGVGLKKIITPLKGFVAYKEHPWILPAFASGVVLGIFALGMIAGQKARRRVPA